MTSCRGSRSQACTVPVTTSGQWGTAPAVLRSLLCGLQVAPRVHRAHGPTGALLRVPSAVTSTPLHHHHQGHQPHTSRAKAAV